MRDTLKTTSDVDWWLVSGVGLGDVLSLGGWKSGERLALRNYFTKNQKSNLSNPSYPNPGSFKEPFKASISILTRFVLHLITVV